MRRLQRPDCVVRRLWGAPERWLRVRLMGEGALCGGAGPWPPLPPDLEPSGAWPEHPDDRPGPSAETMRWAAAANVRFEAREWTPCDWETHNLVEDEEDPELCGLLVGDVIAGGDLPVCGVCGLEVTVFVRKEQSDGVE